MNKIVFGIIIATVMSGNAVAQTETVTSTITTVDAVGVSQDYTFDLDQTTDSSLAPLPIDAGDYEIASPGEIQTTESFTFDLK